MTTRGGALSTEYSPSRMRSSSMNTNNVTCDTWMTPGETISSGVIRVSVPTESSREDTRILSDRVLWRLCHSDRPLSRRNCRNSRIVGTEQCTGFSLWPSHHSENNFHLLSYCSRVEEALAFKMVCLTGSTQLLSSGSGPPAAKHTAGGVEDWGAEIRPPS